MENSINSKYGAALNVNQANLSVVKNTSFSSAREVFNDVARLESRIDSIVNALAGVSCVACDESEAPRPQPNGAFDDLSVRANDAARAIARIDAALSRLEREF